MYTSKYYTCEQVDQRLLQGYYEDAVAAGYTGSKAQYLAGLLKAINYSANPTLTADKVVYNPAISGLTSKNVKAALYELENSIENLTGIQNKDISTEHVLSSNLSVWESAEDTTRKFPLEQWKVRDTTDQGWKSKTFPQIDISQYDSVEISGIVSGQHWSTYKKLSGGLNIFVNGIWKNQIHTPTYTIYPQQLKENDSDKVVILLSTNPNVTPYIKVNKKASVANTDELDKVSTLANENKANIATLFDTIKGITDKDISANYPLSELHYYWKGGVNANLDEWTQIYHADRNTKAFPKIDISIYDSVEVSSIANGSSWSTSIELAGGLHVFVNGNRKLDVNTPATYTIYPQQLKENDDDVVVMLLTIYNSTTPKIVVNKNKAVATPSELNDVNDKVTEVKGEVDNILSSLNGIQNKDISTEHVLSSNLSVWESAEDTTRKFPLEQWKVRDIIDQGWKSKTFPQIDISQYDSVEISGIVSGQHWSTYKKLSGGLNIFVNGIWKNQIHTPTYTIYPQQLKENDSDKVVILLSTNPNVTPYIKVNKKGITENDVKDITKIILCGDSLCGNDSGLIVKEMKSILAKYSYSLVPRTMGGENMIGNLTRAGGLPIRVAEEFTIPADKRAINIKLLSGWMNSKGVYVSNPYGSISDNPHNVNINGIEGNLQKIVAYGMCTYDSNKKFIKSYTAYPINLTTDVNVAYVRFCANNPQVGVTHITIGGEAKDVNALLSLNGSLDYTGAYKENTAFKTSDFIAVSNSTIYADALAVSDTYTFKRNNDGVASKCGKYNIGYDAALYNDQDAVHIWFTGQNGGYDSDEEWADMIEQAARNFGEKFIVCSTALERTTDTLVYAAQKKFGKRYLNLRDYTQNQAVYDGQRFGLIDSSKTASDYSTLFWGSDRIHQNNLLSYLWAVKMWNMIVDFGWMKGELIEDGSFYIK